ncbi:glycosyltransferase [uncultured Pontibacter sp.]|uniref:glycosyltransferase n=1 Tax=uncultured Pontibacter sp. TaxID=453356 RepID=UPI002629E23E|nr:glycosyltransferase [uncultured Pontibacter sp.]
MPNLLVISHDASRTGAPILLLHFLKYLKNNNESINIDIIIAKDGALVPEFSALGNTLVLQKEAKTSKNKFISFFYRIQSICFSTSLKADITKFIHSKRYDVIFSNTIVNGYLLNIIKPKGRVLTYVHELENAIRRFTTQEALNYTLKFTNHFLAPSKAVADNLINKYGITGDNVSLLHYYIPKVEISKEEQNKLLNDLSLKDSIIIGGAGTCDWRKGSDIFLQVAVQILKIGMNLPIKFLWIGADKNSEDFKRLIYDAYQAGVAKDIVIIDSVSNAVDYISIMDVFLLTSREDPYPLVVLEAAMQSKPIICFENSGGAVEFVIKSGGIVIPYLDILKLVEALSELILSKELRSTLGDNAYKTYAELHSEQKTVPCFEAFLFNK